MSNPYSASDTPLAPPMDDQELADLGSRFLASILDSILGWLPIVPAVVVMFAFRDQNGELPEDPPPLVMGVMLLGVAGMFAVAIWQWVQITNSGQTYGKKVAGIRIVRTDGSPVDFVRGVILRMWLVNFASGIANQCCLGWVVFLADVLPIFGEQRRCLHDLIADTKVVVAGGS